MDYSKYMKKAMELAQEASYFGEVPVGAVIVKDGEIIGQGRNNCEKGKNPTFHAETLAIGEACKRIGDWRLTNCVMFVTLEPCQMCAGAIINSRLEKLIFGAYDENAGAFASRLNLKENSISDNLSVVGGYMEKENSKLLSDFFIKRRNEKENSKI